MSNSTSFPEHFLWGASTSAYQVEGAAESNGKLASQQDILNTVNGLNKAAVASDHYNRYQEDVALMKELGLTSYRFSFSWARIFPEGSGRVNEEGILFYHNLVDELIANNITPIATLYHYDMPMALVDKYNGWVDRKSVEDFKNYAEYLIKSFAEKIKYWLTINEQSIIVEYWTSKNFIPQEMQNNQQLRYQINHHMNLAHAYACKAVHDLIPDGKVGAALGYSPVYPLTSTAEDNLAALNANLIRNTFYTDVYLKGKYNDTSLAILKSLGIAPDISEGDEDIMLEGYSDLLAVNYYYSSTAKHCPPNVPKVDSGVNKTGTKGNMKQYENLPGFYEMCKNPLLDTTEWDWAIDPSGLEYILRDLHTRYEIPLMITENGIAGYDKLEEDGSIRDDYRIEYIANHLLAIKNAIDLGANVISYNPWSFIDVLSTSNGYSKRYGLVYVNRTDDNLMDLSRHKKKSFYWYKEIISSNGNINIEHKNND